MSHALKGIRNICIINGQRSLFIKNVFELVGEF